MPTCPINRAPRIFKASLKDAGKAFAAIAQECSASTREDFLSTMRIETLATIPTCTASVAGWSHVSLVTGRGALPALTRTCVCSANNAQAFFGACAGMSEYIADNYCSESAPKEPQNALPPLEALLRSVDAETGAITFFGAQNNRIRILLMPAEGKKDFVGTVYIERTQPMETPSITRYTLVLPQTIAEDAGNYTQINVFATELAVCIADAVLKEKPRGWQELGRNVVAEWEQDGSSDIPTVRIYGHYRSCGGADHLKCLIRVYKPIAAHLLAQLCNGHPSMPAVPQLIGSVIKATANPRTIGLP